MLFFWPVLITQIWGLVEQAKLDDRALEVAERACVARTSAFATDSQSTSTGTKFCPECGTRVAVSTKFCSECGSKL